MEPARRQLLHARGAARVRPGTLTGCTQVLLLELVEPLDLQRARSELGGKHVVLGPQVGLVLA